MQFASSFVDMSVPRVMGILNVTPDSFYDGGRYAAVRGDLSPALSQAEAMVCAGASFIDVGGESTRPGAEPVTEQEEMDRVLPVIESIARELDVVISVDTSTPNVMIEAAKLGAGLINDVRALTRAGALEAAESTKLPVCLMHMQGQPKTMQADPSYADVVDEVESFLLERASACEKQGIPRDKLLLDPGFGFGKKDAHNLALLKNTGRLKRHGMPILVGLSRKSLLGRLLGRELDERLAGSLALAQHALHYGASVIRVHDVSETVDVVKLYTLIQELDD